MPYLTIGISLLMLISCEKKREIVDYIYTVDHIYVNNSGQNLTMEVYNRHDEMFESFNIELGDSVKTHTSREFVRHAIFHFESFTYKIGDSVIVKFADGKCLTYLDQIINNKIFNIEEYDNYDPELIKPGIPYSLYYTFTRKDYDLAVDCE
jgi:hypothetical protein